MQGKKIMLKTEWDVNNIPMLGGKNKVITQCPWGGNSELPDKAPCKGRMVITEKDLQKKIKLAEKSPYRWEEQSDGKSFM